jgi:hypothetical protein
MSIHDLTFCDVIKRNAIWFGDQDAWFEVDCQKYASFSDSKKKVDHWHWRVLYRNRALRKGKGLACSGRTTWSVF